MVGRSYRVEGVAREHDAGLERNLLSREPIGVAGAVVVLVRAADDEPDLAELLDRREDAFAEDGVGLDNRAFVGRERPGFRQDPGGDADLPDVVEEGAQLEALELVRLQAQFLTDPEREVGDPARVRRRVLVLCLECIREGLDGCEERALERLVARRRLECESCLAGDAPEQLEIPVVVCRARPDRSRDDAPAPSTMNGAIAKRPSARSGTRAIAA